MSFELSKSRLLVLRNILLRQLENEPKHTLETILNSKKPHEQFERFLFMKNEFKKIVQEETQETSETRVLALFSLLVSLGFLGLFFVESKRKN